MATRGRSCPGTQQNCAISENSWLNGLLIRRRKLRLHRFGKRVRPGKRPHHHRQLAHEAVFVEAQDVDAVELAVAHTRLEDKSGRIAPVETLDVTEVLEYLGDSDEESRDRIPVAVRLVDDRAAEDDFGRQPRDDLRGIAGFDRFLEGLGADAWSLSPRC
jgi:hypothetical protein